MSKRVYYWDFFGPRATPTAEHFQRHLRSFLDQNGCAGVTSLDSQAQGHVAVSCSVDLEWAERIERSLKPKRSSDPA
ncbi:MAG TPA: hypothetical protein VGP93_09030 [Polyangiaceae bacterium]|nr:hypothetical protein [Polyangiaceae bacterium]